MAVVTCLAHALGSGRDKLMVSEPGYDLWALWSLDCDFVDWVELRL